MKKYSFPEYRDEEPVHPQLSSLLSRLLVGRGVVGQEEAESFLLPDYEAHLHDPCLLHQMSEACERIGLAMTRGERIAIFSDYDCDGIPGAVILHDFFKLVGYDNFQNYIPHRHYEGFGLSKSALDNLHVAGVTLIITIDCGTSNLKEVSYANELGMEVIITDHHEPGLVLPEAIAVVNPKLGKYPFPDLCGAGVAFKLTQALLVSGTYDVKPGAEKWWLDMVGVATIADMVPLVGENRVLAHYGLKVLRKSRRPGLQQLLKKARVDQRYLNEEDIGFIIGPRINAASRMDAPEDAFFMLSETVVEKAGAHVDHLERLNVDRKTQVALMTKDLHQRLKLTEEIPNVLVMGNPKWRPSLVGLVANKLAEEHERPVFLWGVDGNGVYKGSCRSGGGVSVVKLMQAVSEVFHEHGGHHFSGGFSVRSEHIFTFGERLVQAMGELGEEVLIKEAVSIDAELDLGDVNDSLLNDLISLSPFGVGNPKPLFAFRAVVPQTVEVFGKIKEHTKLVFQTKRARLEAIAFFRLPEQFIKIPQAGESCTLLAHVEQSFFMGRRQIRLRVVEVM